MFAASKVLVVAGKGGVGKTTVCASLAIAAARNGANTLIVELERHSVIGPMLGLGPLEYEPKRLDSAFWGLSGRVDARRIQPDEALAEYLDGAGIGPLVKRFSRTGAIDVVATAAPGIRDLVVLGKIRQLEQANVADLVLIDAPATGHALSFLQSPAGLAASATTGRIKNQADQVLEMLSDEQRCQVALVTLPEETPISETIEAAYSLEEDVGIKLAPIIVNGVWPTIEGLPQGPDADPLARYRLTRIRSQQAEIERLTEELPLPQLTLDYRFGTELDLHDLLALADQCSTR